MDTVIVHRINNNNKIKRGEKSSAILKIIAWCTCPFISWKTILIHVLKVVGKNLLLLLSFLFLPQDKLQGPFSVVVVVCSQSFSLHYQAFWQCEVAISHSNVMWTDSWDASGNCWWSWQMLGSGVNCLAGLSWEHGCLTGIAQSIRVSVHTIGGCCSVQGRLQIKNTL